MCPWNGILQWKEIERFGYFWHGKLTLKVKNWQFLSSEFGTLARNMKMPCESFLISGQSCALDLMRNPKFESKKLSSHHVPHVFLNLGLFMGSPPWVSHVTDKTYLGIPVYSETWILIANKIESQSQTASNILYDHVCQDHVKK